MGSAPRDRRLESLQYLRGLAAMMVVFHHACFQRDWRFSPLAWFTGSGAGVEIFFVISGVVIYLAARGEPAREFVRRRLVRVAPLYWLATTAYLVLLLRHHPDLAGILWDYLRSLLFVPYGPAAAPQMIFPILNVGWTLDYEMFFYALFLLGILIGRVTATITAAVLVLVVAGWTTLLAPTTLVLTYTNPLLLDFLAGLWLARSLGSRWLPRTAALLPLGLALLLFGDWFGPALPRLVRAGLPSMAVVAGALGLELRRALPRVPLLTLLGDASYSIYLSHSFTLIVAEVLMKRVPIGGWPQFLLWLVVALVASALVGIAVHRWIERPLTRWLGRLTAPRDTMRERREKLAT